MKTSWPLPLLVALLIPLSLRADDLVQPKQNLTSCLSNLKNVGTAMEMYSTDHQGRYPDKLSELTPDFLKKIPDCPQAEKDTYSGSLKVGHSPEKYSIACQGDYHKMLGVLAGGPRYTSDVGLITGLPPTPGQALLQKHLAVLKKAEAFQLEFANRRLELAKLQGDYAARQRGKQEPAAAVAALDQGAASMPAPQVEVFSAPPISAAEARALTEEKLQYKVELADGQITAFSSRVEVHDYVTTLQKIAWLKKQLAQP